VRPKHELEFEQFVAASGSRLLRTAYLLTGDLGEAEDLLQTTLERTARRWHRLSGAPEAYARVVLANLATDRWRRLRARPAEVHEQPTAAAGGDLAGTVALRQALIAALMQLTMRQRAVLVLRFFDDLTEAQTAIALNISVGTVKSTTSRALAQLRELSELSDTADLTETDVAASPKTEEIKR
jgi:RNA polymerase sigma-70 factor (sigma-E family)